MSMENQWAFLPPARSNVQPVPQLLIRCSFGTDRYTVSLTDLSHVWSESLTRREIIKRALNENTSIDPTEDNAQLRILLDTIKRPLTSEDGVLELAKQSNETILVRATARLPAPLDALSWTFRLSLEPDSAIKHDVIAPICVLAYKQQQEIQDLLKHLREKDHVISKLLDSVENSNAELGSIFPSIAGMKLSSGTSRREQAIQHVPGLGPFDEDDWQDELARRDTAYKDVKVKSIALTAENVSLFEALCQDSKTTQSSADWWEELGELPANIPDVDTTPPTPAADEQQADREPPRRAPNDDETESEEEGYQKQATPPHLRSRRSPSPDQSIGRRTASPKAPDESAVEARSRKSPGKHLGRLGGRSRTPQSPSGSITRIRAASSDVDDAASRSHDETRKPVRKLGKIGGKADKSRQADAAPSTLSRNGHATDSMSDRSTPKRDLAHRQTAPTPENASSTGAGSKPHGMSPVQERSAEDLANRKREELKRQLQAQEQAPTKKKRRF